MSKDLSLSKSIFGIDLSSQNPMVSGSMPIGNPFDYELESSSHLHSDCSRGPMSHWKGGPQLTGTTIVSMQFKDGVMLGADSRTSVGGQYVANRLTDKLQPLVDNIFIQRSGASAHTQNVGDYVAHYLTNLSQELDEPPRVRTAAQLIQSMCYSNKSWISASIIVAGWDKYDGGQIYSCPSGATLAKKVPFAVGGSGSSYIYGFVDANFKGNSHWDHGKARNMLRRAISHAVHRDGSSGGIIRTLSITEHGLFRQTNEPFAVGGAAKSQQQQPVVSGIV